MTGRNSPRIGLDQVRPLGARLTFVEREWLPSLFRRIGYGMGSSADDIVRWCGLYDLNSVARRRLGSRLPIAAFKGIEAGLGFTAEQIKTTAMEYLPDDLVNLREDGNPSQSKNWTRGGGTRFCVECLRERPGVFYTHWRLWWSFICERHFTVLRSSCPSCHNEIVEATITERCCRDPSLCWGKLADDSLCLRPLTDTWEESAVDAGSPMLHAQLSLARAWMGELPGVPLILSATFRGTARALLGAQDVERIARLAEVAEGELVGLFDDPNRIRVTPPSEPFAMAALLGAAYTLITDNERLVRDNIREITFSRPVVSTEAFEGPGSARHLLSFWPGVDARMRGRILRALDRDLPPIQRLVHGSAASAEAAESFELLRESWSTPGSSPSAIRALVNAPGSRSAGTWADRAIPKLLWPSWAAPLGVDERTEATTLQAALADALRIAGTGALPEVDEVTGIGKRLRPSMLGHELQTDSILRQLCELTLALRAQAVPIDYASRLRIPTDQLLLETHWNTLAESVGEDPGKHRRLLNASRYAFLRMSAAAPRDLPTSLRFRSNVSDDVAEYTQFILTMSAELKVAIDQYLLGWLYRFEPREPGSQNEVTVVWEPARFKHHGAHLAPELDDIDLPKLHVLIKDGVSSLGRLADSVARTPRHVRWAIAAHPAPSGRLITPIDWWFELARLPDRRPTLIPDAYLPVPDTSWMKIIGL